MEKQLRAWCELANTVAYEVDGVRNTCIHTSHALIEFLRLQGLQADPFRARVQVFPTAEFEKRLGRLANGSGGGFRWHSLSPNGWAGHLAVSCGDYVLDPTLDQFEAEGLRPSPAVFTKPKGWDEPPLDRSWQGGVWYDWTEGDLEIGHARHPKQIGWKSKPAARPSRWMDLVELMLERK